MSNVCGKCGSGAYAAWEGCGAETRPGESIDEVNQAATEDGWLLVKTHDGHVEAFVCLACKTEYERTTA